VIRAARVVAGIIVVSTVGFGARARAEVTLVAPPGGPPNGWEVYTTGRVGAFVEVLQGEGIPQAFGTDPMTGLPIAIHPISDGGVRAGLTDPKLNPDGSSGQGPLGASRVRSGFLPNILGVGLRRQLTEWTRIDAFISVWAAAETINRRTFHANNPDVREAYARFEGPWGSLLAGRALSLFSRGAVEIDFLYGHGYGVGNPAGFDEQGPSAGHIGYGIIAPFFVAGVVYATPKFHGLQATIGYYDPATTVGIYWGRTKYGRPEAELAYDLASGPFKLHLFASGAWQKLYSLNLGQDANGNNIDVRPSADVIGGAGGARIEVGRVHLGLAGHRGRGLGVGYFLDGSDANFAKDTTHELRVFSGAYAQAQVIAGPFDLNAGWGVTWIDPLDADTNPNWCNPQPGMTCGGFDTKTGTPLPSSSILKQQMGWSGVIVYHLSPSVHFAADYFLSKVKWMQGEQQTVHSYNLGTTITW
jgi:predicted porin